MFTVTKLEGENNPAVLNLKINIYNDGVHTTLINVTVEIYKTILSLKCYLKVSQAANKFDLKYSQPGLNTVFDVASILNGAVVNPLAKPFLANFYKSIDYEPKFPFPPVSSFIFCKMCNVFMVVNGFF